MVERSLQSTGGRELILQHRPDIADSAYQLFVHWNRVSHGLSVIGNPSFSTTASLSAWDQIYLTDTCSKQFRNIAITKAFGGNPHILSQNPFTGDSTDGYIHPFCPPGLPAAQGSGFIKYVSVDSFEYMRSYWVDTIIYLPYKCGQWQISTRHGPNAGSPGGFSNVSTQYAFADSSTNIEYPCQLPEVLINGTYHRPNFEYAPNALIQFSNLQPNSMPAYISEVDIVRETHKQASFLPTSFDNEGDSLVFTSSMDVTTQRIVPYRDNNLQSYTSGVILPHEVLAFYNPITFSFDTILVASDSVVSHYKCIPGQSGPGCTTYNALNNPFDCDSTYSVNPNTGEIRFVTKTPGQHVNLTLKIDEYRNGTWLSTSYRHHRMHTTDSTSYDSNPQLALDSANVLNAAIGSDLSFAACPGSQISIPIDFIEPQQLGRLTISDNHDINIPSSNIIYTNSNTDSVRALFVWNSLPTDSGMYSIVFKIIDSACQANNRVYQHQRIMKIFISKQGISTIPDTSICAGDNVTLFTTGAGSNINWNVLNGTPGSLSCTNCQNPTVTPTTTTTYEAVSQLTGGCKARDTVTVFVQENYTVTAPDVTACGPKDSVQLKATISSTLATAAQIISWQPIAGIIGNNNAKNIAVNPNVDTTYIVTVADTLGCFMASDTVNIRYDKNFTATLNAEKTDICIGDTVELTILATGISGITYSPNYNITNLTGPATQVYPDINTTYTATIKSNASNCELMLSRSISVANLNADAGPDHEIYDGEEVILGGPNYKCDNGCELTWIPGIYIIDPGNYDMGRALVRARKSIRYVQILRSGAGGCEDRDTVNITVKCTDIYMPNIFSPDSENLNRKNHTYGPNNIGLVNMEFRIFNRWGQQVFHSTSPDNRWTGEYNGKPQPPGVYVWKIKARCPDNNSVIEKVGNVTLVR